MVNDCHRLDTLTGLTRKYAAWKAEKEWTIFETAQIDETLAKSSEFDVAHRAESI